ncbi:MAG: DNA-directed RNA polymerase subunit K [Thermoplasmata archaeon]|nr:MAG: DNA-directed RNA polymerase subunit K [Thermoplasmata archaeon]
MEYTRFEKARIIGARALQVTMGAPVLLEISKKIIDPIIIATMEYDNDVVPITVRRDRKAN